MVLYGYAPCILIALYHHMPCMCPYPQALGCLRPIQLVDIGVEPATWPITAQKLFAFLVLACFGVDSFIYTVLLPGGLQNQTGMLCIYYVKRRRNPHSAMLAAQQYTKDQGQQDPFSPIWPS